MFAIEPEQLMKALGERRATTILDVRSGAEYRRGHVPGALHAPFWNVARLARAAPLEAPGATVYCGLGPRAWFAIGALRLMGRRAVPLRGHMAAWRRAGLALER